MLKINTTRVRISFWTAVTVLLLAVVSGCATSGAKGASGPRSSAVEAATDHGHSPWRFKGRHGDRSMFPRHAGQEAILACNRCDGANEGIVSQ